MGNKNSNDNKNNHIITKVIDNNRIYPSTIPSSPSTPTVTGAIAKEVLEEALSKPSKEAIAQNNRDSELLKELRSN